MDSQKQRTAYILQIHKNPDQANIFIKQIILQQRADVYIHLDKKTYEQLNKRIIKHPNVMILQKSIDVKWGDITQVDATLLLLKEVISSGKNYDFVCFRSGQDLLVKNGFKDFLLNNKNKIFMNAYHVKSRESHAAFVNVKWPNFARSLYINPFHPKRLVRRGIALIYGLGINIFPNKDTLPENFSLYNGSNWFCIPLEVANFILEFLNKNQWYYNAFKNSLVPDEFFFQTLIMNSKYRKAVVNNNLMYIKFGESLKNRNNPIILKVEHIGNIKSSNEFFARKFDEQVDNQIIDYYFKEVKM